MLRNTKINLRKVDFIVTALTKRTLNSHCNGVVKSKYSCIDVPSASISELLLDKSRNWPNRTALVCAETGRSYTFNDIFRKSRNLKGFLQSKLKLEKDDLVAVILPNIPEYGIVLLGALEAGLKVTTVNPLYTNDEMKRQLISSEPKAIFAFNDIVPAVQELMRTLHDMFIISVNTQRDQFVHPGSIKYTEIVENSFETHQVSPDFDDVALLLYSSGTTGLPKGVQLTHRNIITNQMQCSIHEFNLFGRSDKNVLSTSMSFFHSGGLNAIISSLAHGSKLIATPRLGTKVLQQQLIDHKPNLGIYTPTVVQMLTTSPKFPSQTLQSFQYVHVAGAPLGATDIERFEHKAQGKVHIIPGYGLTETSPVTHRLPLDDYIPRERLGTVGTLIPRTEAKIVPIEGNDVSPLPSRKSGEIMLRGPQVMKGYHKNHKATAETISEDGWLKTGDFGYMDEEGYLFVTDRLKELIKVKGFQVAPAELEELLRIHPAVAEAAVVGIKHETFGEAPKAFLVLKKDKRANEADIKDFVKGKVVSYKQLVEVTFLDELPKSATGKVLRRELKNF